MAFTGNAVTETVSTRKVRVVGDQPDGTGLTLAAGASGTLGLAGDATADVELPADFKPENYGDVDLLESVECRVNNLTAPTTAEGATFIVTKTLSPFQIAIAHADGANATGDLELYVEFH